MTTTYALDFFKSLFRIHRHLQHTVPSSLSTHINATEILILHFLTEAKTCKTSDLSRYLGLPGSTLTGILDRMEKKGYITRSKDKTDRRVVTISAGPEIHKGKEQLKKSLQEYIDNKFGGLSDEWWKAMAQELQKLERLMQQKELRQIEQ